MEMYKVGSKFPHNQYLHRGEITASMLNTSFFDVVCVLSSLTRQEKREWKKSKLSIALYEQLNVPFLVFDFGTWNFDVSINIHKVKSQKNIENWLNSEGNTITLFLVSAETGNLEAMRYISIHSKIANKIREICKNQKAFPLEKIDINTQQIMLVKSTNEMLRESKLKQKL